MTLKNQMRRLKRSQEIRMKKRKLKRKNTKRRILKRCKFQDVLKNVLHIMINMCKLDLTLLFICPV